MHRRYGHNLQMYLVRRTLAVPRRFTVVFISHFVQLFIYLLLLLRTGEQSTVQYTAQAGTARLKH